VLHKKCIDPNNKEVCSVVKDCGVIDGIKTLGSENWKLGNPGDWESIKGHYYSDKLTQPAHKQAFRKTLGCVAGSLYRNYPEYGECNKFIEPFRKPQPGTSLANRPSSQVAKKPNSNASGAPGKSQVAKSQVAKKPNSNSNSNSNAPKSQVAKKPNSNASGAPGKSQVAKKPNSNAGKKTQDPAPRKVHSTLTVKERQNLLEAKKNTGKSFGF
jgi:sulfite reductase alpha subunit-like flavoprotein